MSRFADALKRARTGSVPGSIQDDDREGDAIRFLAPGQPAVIAPWDIGRDAPAPAIPEMPRPAPAAAPELPRPTVEVPRPTVEVPRPTVSERRASMPFPERNHA